jgi:hypothetical protein
MAEKETSTVQTKAGYREIIVSPSAGRIYPDKFFHLLRKKSVAI